MCVMVKLTGVLTLRTGIDESRVIVSENATITDVIEKLAKENGPQIRPALLKGDRLRSDTVVVRESRDDSQNLSSDSVVKPGDTVRFQFEDPDRRLYA